MKEKTAFVITWIIVELSIVAIIVSQWLAPRLWLSTRLFTTAVSTMVFAFITFVIYLIYIDHFKETEK